jgi:hypothetical protein
MAELRWQHEGQRLVLPIAILPSLAAANSNEIVIVEGLIDTGATGTGLRPDIAERLALKARGRRRVLTANGDMLVAEYRLRIGFFPGQFEGPAGMPQASFPTVLDFGILAHALHPMFSYELLIGMDVLSRCDLTLRRDRSVELVLP